MRIGGTGGGYHIVAVLNACTDNSREILERYLHRLPLTLVEEPRCGKNHALNRGLAEARGELLVFSDDDVVPLKTWLVAYERMARERPEFDIFGGRILPYWMAEPPSWVLERVPMGPVFAVHPADLAGGETHHGMIWGPNMMVRSRVFAAGYRFNGDVGPDGTNTYAMGSESEFLERLSAAGYRSWFCGECAVQHMIRPWQLETEWIVGRAFRYGRFRYDHGERKLWGDVPMWRGLPRWMWRRYLANLASMRWLRWCGREWDYFRVAWEAEYFKGLLHEARRRN